MLLLVVDSLEDGVVLKELVALVADLNHGADDLLFDVEGAEAEIAEVLGEVVLRYRDHALVGHLLRRLLGRQREVGRNHFLEFFFALLEVFLHNNEVHGAREVHIDVVQNLGSVHLRLGLEIAASSGHL